jgi:DME family drug/metabolite transporter
VVRRLASRIGAARAVSYHAFLAAVAILPWADLWAIREAGARALWLVAGALGPGALAGWLFVRALPTVGATRAAVLAFLEPLVAVGVGWAVWDERLGTASIAGALLVLSAGLWVTRRARSPVA